ncbi:DDE endonuclease [Streptomyces sp. NPDC007856]|uniref:DDE endonuclease n=1 Tax=Streptomyces sp. NPDC007856 TaxID=3364781 RepID=UPI0036D2043F
MVRVRGRGSGRVNIAGVVCYRTGHRSRFFYTLHIWHGCRGEPKAFSWRQYRGLITMTHLQLGTPVVWCWDNLNVHLVKELADFANRAQGLVTDLPDVLLRTGVEPGRGYLVPHLADFAAADLAHLTRVIKRYLKKIQYRPHLADGCLPPTGLIMDHRPMRQPDITSST